MYKFEINLEISEKIIKHLKERAHFVDADLITEWDNGINFLYDFGLVSLEQFSELYNIFLGESNNENII